jgi:hypothetical protein
MFKDAKQYDQKLPAWNKGLATWTHEMKANQSKIGKRVMSCPKQRKAKSLLFAETIKKLDAQDKSWRQKGTKNRKPVMTPYGEFPSALQAGKECGPKLGLKPGTIQRYIERPSEKYADWYYIEETA